MKKKKIIVPTIGQIPLLGGIAGPILKPFLQDVETIRHLITVGCDIEEVFEDGSTLKLTLYNYDKDNYVPKKKKNTEQPKMMQTNDTMVEDRTPEDGVTTTKEQPKNGVDKGVQNNKDRGNRREEKRNPKQFYGGKQQKNNK